MTITVRVAQSRALDRWDVKQMLALSWHRPAAELRAIGDVAVRRTEASSSVLRLGSIHFDGKISLRPAEASIKGRTFVAHPGDVVFSKIDVRNGAIGVVPEEFGKLAFSPEYPIFDMSAVGEVLSAYMRILCRTAVFRSQVQALVVGHSGRKRVSPELFESLTIPVPPLEEQHRIVRAELEAQDRIQHLRTVETSVLADAVQEISDFLGLVSTHIAPIKFPFVAQSVRLDRWSVSSAVAGVRGVARELVSDYPVRPLGDLAVVSYGLQKSPTNRPGKHAHPYLRVANVQNGYLDLDEMKTIEVPPAQLDLFLLKPGDVLLCEGNSADLVGRPAIWSGEIEKCVHQNHVLRVRMESDELLPEYLLAYMQTAPSRLHFRQRAKQTTNLATINSTDVRELSIPVPGVAEQRKIAALWADAQLQAQVAKRQAREEENRSRRQIEMMISEGVAV
ncbi:restriction endonuclease subunit S [Kitasatospora sp. NA04385]|uniref:restriction endonuclease subunit S n=1 Tax=Kitasatospora sp. NA04385 TaxID=2742135 RepID=UPI0015927D9D|nr:restriction endonuclease subunit S [Kitasatospora sp. NA04385]QKW20940.1 restriction endonuclease subunit S [Kitasatospora sp. NA04385]